MSRISPSEQKNQALREMFEQRFEAGAERELMLSELIRLTTEKTLLEMLDAFRVEFEFGFAVFQGVVTESGVSGR